MEEIIGKYEAKLELMDKSIDATRHLLDKDTLEMLMDVKVLLTEVVTDFRAIEIMLKHKS